MGNEWIAVRKEFALAVHVVCGCGCLMERFHSGASIFCPNGACSEYLVEYQAPRIALELKRAMTVVQTPGSGTAQEVLRDSGA